MKKATRFILTAALCAMTLCGGVLATGAFVEPPVTVQLNGEMLEFTDAKPQLTNERTFLPFYAVFNALGADVQWNEAEPDKVVAVRDGKTLTMNIGSTQVSLEEDGVVRTITMDVAPYLDPETNRTYVPVFFAADALDCKVGWDPYTFTAIIVDTDALVEKAMEGKSYTWIKKLASFSREGDYRKGIWDMEAFGSGTVKLLGAELPVTVNATGTQENGRKLAVEAGMTMDMTQLITLMGQEGETPAGIDLDKVKAMAENGVRVEMRGDLSTGTVYQRMTGAILAGQVEEESWYSTPLRSTLDRMGSPVDWISAADLQNAILCADYHAMADAVLTERGLTDTAKSYREGKEAVEHLFAALSDASFTQAGNKVSTVWALVGDGVAADLEVTLTVEGKEVKGCVMTAREQAPTITIAMEMRLTQPGEMTGCLKWAMEPLMSQELTLTVKRTAGETAPEALPPEGAQVKPYEGLIPVKQ